MKWNKKFNKWLIEISIVIVVLVSIRAWTQRDIISGQVPLLSAKTLTGETINLATQRQQPLLIHFWASWCPVCEFEQNSIQSISSDYPVLSIAMSSGTNDEIMAYMKKSGINFKVVNDIAGTWVNHFGIKGVPVSFIVDNNNNIKFKEVGYTTEWGLRLRLWWAGL